MTNTTNITGTAALVGDYVAAWNETDAQRRRELIDRTFTGQATYLDPLMSGEGHGGIEPIALGIDFGELAADGRLRCVTGFLEHV